MTPVNKGIRIINLVIDITFIAIITLILTAIFGLYIDRRLLFIIVLLCYYFSMEYFTGQTIGKVITKTKVVDFKNTKPSLLKILIRTILRLNPFDSYSYLFGTELGSHDSLSRTLIITKTSAQQQI
jgi:uncharacterized RDD family membrane protein YckC